jgi:hypothetical protein
MQAQMKAVALPPARPTRETYEMVLVQRERLKAAIRLYFEEHGLGADRNAPARHLQTAWPRRPPGRGLGNFR